MSALSLLLLAAQITELGTVEFPAGPARGTAHYYFSDTPERLDFFMNDEGLGHPNCEGMFRRFDHGRLASKHDSMD